MKHNKHLQSAIFEAIDNQLEANEPPETGLTFRRLLNAGHSEYEAKQLIGQAMAIELWDIMKNKAVFNEKRYIQNLEELPKEPKTLITI